MSTGQKDNQEKSLTRMLGKHLSRLIMLCNLLALLWLYVCCLITWIPCDTYPKLSLVTISFPIALLVNLLFVLFWLFINVKRIWVPVLGLLLCSSYILDYYPLNFGDERPDDALKVVSWNTHGLGGAEGRDSAIQYLKNIDADIICLQETTLDETLISGMAELGYEAHQQNTHALFTRLHILQTDTLSYETRSNGSQWYLLEHGGDTIVLVNNHLESNGLSQEIKDEYVQVLREPEYERAKESGRSILSLMSTSARYRGNQTKALHSFVQQYAGKHIIVCGDFNDTPISYAYQTLARHMKNAYRDSGRGIGVSYNQKGFWVRIDHIFFSEEGESGCTSIDRRIDVSDHYPIVSWIKF